MFCVAKQPGDFFVTKAHTERMRPVETYKGASYTVCVVRVEISYQRKANGNSEQRYFNYDSVFYKKKKKYSIWYFMFS